jgi:hypothetical protein
MGEPINEKCEGPTVAISIDLLTKLTTDSRLLDRLLDPEGPFKVLRVNPELHVYWQRQPSVMLLVRTRDEIREVLGEEKTDD